jgi:hypothetical protein
VDIHVIGGVKNMTRAYLNFRPTEGLLEEIDSISLKTGLSLADVTRQLCLKGLDEYQQGSFELEGPETKRNNNGALDKRYLRNTGIQIREKKKGGTPSKVGANDTFAALNTSSTGVFGCD